MSNLLIFDDPFNLRAVLKGIVKTFLLPHVVVFQIEVFHLGRIPLKATFGEVSLQPFPLNDPIQFPVQLHRITLQAGEHILPARHDLCRCCIGFGLLKVTLCAFKVLPLQFNCGEAFPVLEFDGVLTCDIVRNLSDGFDRITERETLLNEVVFYHTENNPRGTYLQKRRKFGHIGITNNDV